MLCWPWAQRAPPTRAGGVHYSSRTVRRANCSRVHPPRRPSGPRRAPELGLVPLPPAAPANSGHRTKSASTQSLRGAAGARTPPCIAAWRVAPGGTQATRAHLPAFPPPGPGARAVCCPVGGNRHFIYFIYLSGFLVLDSGSALPRAVSPWLVQEARCSFFYDLQILANFLLDLISMSRFAPCEVANELMLAVEELLLLILPVCFHSLYSSIQNAVSL